MSGTIVDADYGDQWRLEGIRLGLEAAAKRVEPSPHCSNRKCGCIEQLESGTWIQSCYCQNNGDLAEAQSWCDASNSASDIRAINPTDVLKGGE